MVKIKKQEYRLPTGRTTTNPTKYAKEWRAIAEPFAKLTGARIIGYEPNVLYYSGSYPIDIPCSILEKINSLIKENKKNICVIKFLEENSSARS